METLFWLAVFSAILFAAYLFLRGFDRIAGRGPKQVTDGINAVRVPCPHCAEPIMPAAKLCPHCRTALH